MEELDWEERFEYDDDGHFEDKIRYVRFESNEHRYRVDIDRHRDGWYQETEDSRKFFTLTAALLHVEQMLTYGVPCRLVDLEEDN